MTDEEKKTIATFFSALGDIMRLEGSWSEKKALLKKNASEDDEINLGEFIAWFEEDQS